ncbi:hypothetical protein E1B28_002081 [Marasmius oreades]|uniref:F-box domain-containing protein n=1 Tax=Marasmius oreades TaxID=181124 RepID=A0A9P7RML3_9AGAR|nr:uncharacterized protein E1B28_002081 [Marasmius oreades]KAG7086122.1 hypothetical protein E1B28_002081 [Marasmius oreades]
MITENLPTETIIQIFKTTTDLEFRAGRLPVSLLNCAEVCQRWRSIALRTPDLFTQILIPFSQLRERNFSITKWAKFWFDQSRPYPIAVVIDFNLPNLFEPDHGRFRTFHTLLQDHLIPNISRLISFHYDGTRFNRSTVDLFCPLVEINVDAPILEELVIKCPKVTVFWPLIDIRSQNFFASNPKLRSLTLRGSEYQAPLNNLTSLDVYCMNLLDVPFRQLVKDCPKLEAIAFRDIFLPPVKYSNLDIQLSPIPIPSLRHLTLDFQGAVKGNWMDIYKHVLTSVVAPNLQSLSVSTSPKFFVSLPNVLPNPSSLTNLRTLKLRGIPEEVKNRYTHRITNNSYWFLDLPNPNRIEELHLSNSSGEVLGIELPIPTTLRTQRTQQPRHYSEYRPPQSLLTLSSGDPAAQFTSLTSITVDSNNAEHVLWLCRVLQVRPTVRTVCLSRAACIQSALHLIVTKHGVFSRRELGPEMCNNGVSVEYWIGERVKLRVLSAGLE